MKRKIFTIFLILTMTCLIFASCSKTEADTTNSPVVTNVPKVMPTDLKDFFPYSEGVTLTYTYSDDTKDIKAKIKSVSDNSVIVSHGKESKIEFNNEGLLLNGDFILKFPIEKNSSWDTSTGKATIKNTDYVLSTSLGNISTIEVAIDGDNKSTYYIARNLGIVKMKLNKDGKESELELTSVLAPKVSKDTSTPSDTPEVKTKVSKLYYYDVNEDSVVYIASNSSVTEKDAAKFFEDKFKNPPNSNISKLMPSTTKIKSIKVDTKTSTLTMDVSEVFTESMNLGSSSETGVIQGIANTLGDAYNCKNVVITANGNDFVTGHIEISAKYPVSTTIKESKELK